MRFYLDESGDFAVPDDPTKHAVGIVVGVDIPETVEAEVFEGFRRPEVSTDLLCPMSRALYDRWIGC